MHKLNVLVLGSASFISTLVELKPYLKFNLHEGFTSKNKDKTNFDIVICHEEKEFDAKQDNLNNKSILKILASKNKHKGSNYDGFLNLPTSLNEINSIIEQTISKKTFSKNSSIIIKNYLLNKNEKKLIKDKQFIILTEKEIQLLDLLLAQNKPISKNKILSLVWNYSSEADTHTVETHIYRLRKKINDKFSDLEFILNNKEGYCL
jgi:DNA-binding response OmpR family regulator